LAIADERRQTSSLPHTTPGAVSERNATSMPLWSIFSSRWRKSNMPGKSGTKSAPSA